MAARRRAVHVRPAADRGDGAPARRRGRLARPGEHRYSAAMERAYAWFLGANDLGRRGRRSRARRRLRRPRARRRQPERRRRVDADVADRRPSTSGPSARRRDVAGRRRPRARSPPRHDRRRPSPAAAASIDPAVPDDRSRCSSCDPAQPDPHRRRRPLPRQLGLQPGRGAGRRRDDPAGPRRGPARDLPAPRRAQRATASRTGASIPSRSCAPTSTATPRRPGAARIRG